MTATPKAPDLRIRALQVSEPVARLARRPVPRAGEVTGDLAGIYTHSVTIRIHDVAGPVLVSLAESPVDTVCQARVSSASMRRMRSADLGSPVLLRVAGHDVVATRMVPSGMPRPFEAPPSWFDSVEGDTYGRPRLERAARALATDRDADALGELCGLGIGLTPSGDDALVGLIAASTCAGLGARARRRLAGRLRAGRETGRTTETALSSLRLALAGDFSPPVLDLLRALTGAGSSAGNPPEADAVDRLAHHGHSSGADLMAGINALARAAMTRTTAMSCTPEVSEEGEAS